MAKQKLFYVYRPGISSKLKYVGKVKAPNAKAALKAAHEEHGPEPLDVIRALYVRDRATGSMQ